MTESWHLPVLVVVKTHLTQMLYIKHNCERDFRTWEHFCKSTGSSYWADKKITRETRWTSYPNVHLNLLFHLTGSGSYTTYGIAARSAYFSLARQHILVQLMYGDEKLNGKSACDERYMLCMLFPFDTFSFFSVLYMLQFKFSWTRTWITTDI